LVEVVSAASWLAGCAAGSPAACCVAIVISRPGIPVPAPLRQPIRHRNSRLSASIVSGGRADRPSQLPQDRCRVPQNGSIPDPVRGSSHVGPCPAAADTGPSRASDWLTGGPDRLLHALTAFLPALADCQPPLTPILLQPCPPSARPLANGGHVWDATNSYTQNSVHTKGDAKTS
jgi:hypothetical protein